MPVTVDTDAIGRVVEVGNPHSLANALCELLNAPDDLARMGNAARQRVLEKFSQGKFDATGTLIVRHLQVLLSQR